MVHFESESSQVPSLIYIYVYISQNFIVLTTQVHKILPFRVSMKLLESNNVMRDQSLKIYVKNLKIINKYYIVKRDAIERSVPFFC